ncbi:MAG: DNA-3-methyladenine glycosylase [Methanobacterium sp.]|nr:DNA-3-methyladenine glycosylase [Methanobacterium sp.]
MKMMKSSKQYVRLEKSFYEQNTITVAQRLLGCILIHKVPEGLISGMIVETEAYMGVDDKAAHSYQGKHTPRMDPLYKRGGYAYIYQLHGYNYCLNVVTEKENQPRAVLIRALEPIQGLELMARRRNIKLTADDMKTADKISKKLKNMTNGPSKLCQALGIDTSLNGVDLLGNELYIITGEDLNDRMMATPRINISYAEEYQYEPWRFIIKGNSFLSRLYKIESK